MSEVSKVGQSDRAETVVVPCEPSHAMLIAGMTQLDVWSDDTLAQEIDGMAMAAKVYRAMTSAGEDVLR